MFFFGIFCLFLNVWLISFFLFVVGTFCKGLFYGRTFCSRPLFGGERLFVGRTFWCMTLSP